MIRPEPADWFEIISARDDERRVIATLNDAGCTEIEPVAGSSAVTDAAAGPSGPEPGIYARIRGWTSDMRQLAACLEASRLRALAFFPQAPPELQAPLILRNPGWVQPFEIFARLVGMPGRFCADPSGLLVLVAPIMFGYMFGDVIQGLVLVVIGWSLQKRWPMLRLLIAGGIAATAFGFLYGSMGGIHGVLAPLWIDPLAEPLPVLVAPLAFGGVLLALGVALTGLEAYWRGRLPAWLGSDGGFLVLYAGVLIAFLHPAGEAMMAAGLTIHVVGRLLRERRIGALFAALGDLIEKLARILINTLSFVRVGAFALAHAGLSSALESTAAAASHAIGYVILLLAGNALIIVIEVMVASIQTTRLVLFEFFTRFFDTTGREFHPTHALTRLPEEIPHGAGR